ncbi:hypothetical protein Bca52824_025970 [Brassica carinata]|uniref:Uncharacterized protein n=1 Tax=Brassica carinata TaxID=52824 RepID=A0A8X7SHP6_BRACI|nr:hypothetical protein Bca52824_025970 [Brassica carinata]
MTEKHEDSIIALHKGEKEIVIISEGPRERLVSFLSFYLQLNGREFVLVVFVTNHRSLPRELVNIYEPYELPQRSSVGTKIPIVFNPKLTRSFIELRPIPDPEAITLTRMLASLGSTSTKVFKVLSVAEGFGGYQFNLMTLDQGVEEERWQLVRSDLPRHEPAGAANSVCVRKCIYYQAYLHVLGVYRGRVTVGINSQLQSSTVMFCMESPTSWSKETILTGKFEEDLGYYVQIYLRGFTSCGENIIFTMHEVSMERGGLENRLFPGALAHVVYHNTRTGTFVREAIEAVHFPPTETTGSDTTTVVWNYTESKVWLKKKLEREIV